MTLSTTQTTSTSHRSWSVLALALTAQILVVVDISVVNTALPTIGRALRLTGSDLQWLVTAYLLMSGGGLLLGGRIADLLPRRRVFLIGIAAFTLASLLSGFAGGATELIATRAIQGLGAALMTPAALSIVSTAYTGAQRTRGLALWGAVGSLGIAAGVLLGGVLTTWAGWQMIFWINVPIGSAALVATLRILPKETTARANVRQFDLGGAVTAVSGLAAVMVALGGAADHGWASARTIGLLVVSALMLTAFGLIERRATRPLVPSHTWKVRTLVSATALMLGVTGVLVGAVFLTSIYLQTALGYSALSTGLAFLPLALAITAGAHLAGRLVARTSVRNIAVGGLALTTLGAAVLAMTDAHSPLVTNVLPGTVILGAGAGTTFVSISVTALAGIPPQHAGMASGFLMTGHEVGAALGVAVLSAVATASGDLTTRVGVLSGFSAGFIATALAAAALATLAFVRVPKTAMSGAAAMHMH